MSVFYENYLKICAMSGRTPTRAAIDSGVGKSTVTSWKNEKSNPTDATMTKLCNYLGCLPQHLLDEDGFDRFSDYIAGKTDITGKKRTPTEDGERTTKKDVIEWIKSEATSEELLELIQVAASRL